MTTISEFDQEKHKKKVGRRRFNRFKYKKKKQYGV